MRIRDVTVSMSGSYPVREGSNPFGSTKTKIALGCSSTAERVALDHQIGVRIPASQPASKGSLDL